MTLFRNAVRYAAVTSFAMIAIQPLSSATTLPGSYTTSWVGNSTGTLATHIQQDMFSLYVASDGTCYADCAWEEGATEIGVYKNGAFVSRFDDTSSYQGGTGGICTNGTYFFTATDGDNGVGRYTMSGAHSPFSGGAVDGSVREVATNGVVGLACNGTELYVADRVNNVVHVYDTNSMTQLRSWALSNPGRICMGSSGSLWVVTGSAIKHYDKNGNYLGQQITDVGKPMGICVGGGNKLYAADDGSDQNIKIYTNIDTSPSRTSTLGVVGGALSGAGSTIGTVGALRFVHPQAVGIDGNGNIYVAQRQGTQDSGATGSSVLESYTSGGSRNWVLNGLHWTVACDFDPGSETDIFSPAQHIKVNYGNTTPGSEWSDIGYTLNESKYPSDSRRSNWTCGCWVRRIHGARFLFMGPQNGVPNGVYRFNSATDGEVAIPAGNTPTGNEGCVDSQGNWWDISSGVNKYPINATLDANGAPTWNTGGVVHYGVPANGSGWTEMDRVVYDAANDRMYISGYTNSNPNSNGDWGRAGKVLQRYDNWTGTRTAHYSGDGIVLTGNTTPINDTPKGINVAGNYVFVTLYDVHQIDVYDVNSGAYVGSLVPGANVGGPSAVGNVDMEYPTNVLLRSNGEYVILCEDNYAIKTLMYRWLPGGSSTPGSYEAEASANTIGNGAFVDTNSSASGGQVVRYIGGGGDGYDTINNVTESAAGAQTMTVYYFTGGRDFKVSVNGGADQTLTCPISGGSATMSVALNAGANTIKFHNPGANAPDLDRITVTSTPPAPTSYEGEATANTIGNGAFVDTNASASGGKVVRYIGGGTDGYAIVNSITSTAGSHTLTVYYFTGGRDFKVSVNGGADQTLTCSGSSGSATMTVTLNSGANTIKFHNPGANAPDLDRITIL